MVFFDVVTTQRAMRRLKPDPIPDAALRQILDAAICAPSGGNRQGWSFLVVRLEDRSHGDLQCRDGRRPVHGHLPS